MQRDEPEVGRTTRYYVQPFWRCGATRLVRGDLRQYDEEARAVAAGNTAARRVGGAVVYSVRGNPEFEHWEPPRLIAAIGETPALNW